MRPRLLTVTAVSAFTIASSVLLAVLLFVSQRNLVTTGGAHLQQWVAPETARWLYLLMIVALSAAFMVAALLSTRGTDSDARPWWLGVQVGAVGGILLGIATIVTGAVATTVGPLTAPVLAAYLGALLGPPLVGGWAGRRTGRTGGGAIAGFWFGVLLALISGFAVVLRDSVFADRLVTGAWLLDHFGDSTCNGQTGDTLAACEIGDSFGAMASGWLLFPLLAAGLGALGGLVGRATTKRRTQMSTDRVRTWAPIGLGALLLVVLAAELTFQIW
jgi:hypothetical protein